MFTAEEYITGWCIYLLAVLGLLVLFWVVTRKLPWFHLKQTLRLTVATVLLVPAIVENAPGFLAPAWVKCVLQFVFSGVEGFLPAARVILLSMLLALLVYALLSIGLHMFQRSRQVPQS